jgi:hypothetical protein
MRIESSKQSTRTEPPTAEWDDRADMLAALKQAIATEVSVNTRLLIAALAGNLAELDIVNAELRQARACKDTLMFAYCRHMQRHGC